MAKLKRSRGFTLIEMMVAGAIVAVITTMALAGYSGIAERTAPQNAAYDFSAALSKARARAAERNTNVWMVVFPEAEEPADTKTTTTTTTTTNTNTFSPSAGGGGEGAWALVEDSDGSFHNRLASLNAIEDLTGHQVLASKGLWSYAKKNVQFGVPADGSVAKDGLEIDSKMTGGTTDNNPTKKATLFSSMATAAGCNFCSGSGTSRRGAVVFTPDGEARFYKGDGTRIHPSFGGMLMMTDKSATKRAFLFNISPATSFVTFASN